MVITISIKNSYLMLSRWSWTKLMPNNFKIIWIHIFANSSQTWWISINPSTHLDSHPCTPTSLCTITTPHSTLPDILTKAGPMIQCWPTWKVHFQTQTCKIISILHKTWTQITSNHNILHRIIWVGWVWVLVNLGVDGLNVEYDHILICILMIFLTCTFKLYNLLSNLAHIIFILTSNQCHLRRNKNKLIYPPCLSASRSTFSSTAKVGKKELKKYSLKLILNLRRCFFMWREPLY